MFWRLHNAFAVTCQMVFCRLQVNGAVSAVVKTTGPPKKFEFVGGDVCLDFTNTVGGKRGLSTREYLNSYTDFVSWCQQADLLNASAAGDLLRIAARHPDESAEALQRAISLRETIYRIFAALASGDRKSTRLNSSHLVISYAVFCLKKKKKETICIQTSINM